MPTAALRDISSESSVVPHTRPAPCQFEQVQLVPSPGTKQDDKDDAAAARNDGTKKFQDERMISNKLLLPKKKIYPKQHQNTALINFYETRRKNQEAATRAAEIAYREKMLNHRRKDIWKARDLIQEEAERRWEFSLRGGGGGGKNKKNRGDGNVGEEEEEESHHVMKLTSVAEAKRIEAVKYASLPGSTKQVKKSMFLNSHRLQEYWKQAEEQRMQNIKKNAEVIFYFYFYFYFYF